MLGGLSVTQQNVPVKKIAVHPLVLLSVVDHFNRINSNAREEKRVMGVLLGSINYDKTVDIANSFAVTLKEENKNDMACVVDTKYLEEMFKMFRKVTNKEKVVGWYHTGPTLCKNDIVINEKMKSYTANPVLVVIQPNSTDIGSPTDAYVEVQEIRDDGTPPIKTFEHVPSEIVAELAEEVGVEHLLRDIKGLSAGTLSQRITNQLMGLRGLLSQLADMQRYLRQVSRSELPMNYAVTYCVQELFNLLPDVLMPGFVLSQNTQLNKQMMCVYVGSLVRAIISHHDLIDNKLLLQKKRDEEREKDIKSANRNESVSPTRSVASVKSNMSFSGKDLD